MRLPPHIASIFSRALIALWLREGARESENYDAYIYLCMFMNTATAIKTRETFAITIHSFSMCVCGVNESLTAAASYYYIESDVLPRCMQQQHRICN